MSASLLVQILILIDSLSAKVVGAIKEIGSLDEVSEADLKKLVAEYRAKNDERYEEVLEILKAK